MPVINKPSDINKIWAAGGDKVAPSDTKISNGWAVEVPPRQYFNYLDNKQDQAIAHINQFGVSLWDSATEYQANKSYVQGSDGVIYFCKTTHTNQNPVTDTLNTYWTKAFIYPSDFPLRGAVSYQTAGTFNWVVPVGVTKVLVTVQGGGGGGGGANQPGAAAGGGAGGYSEGLVSVTPGETIVVIVGAGGTGGTATPTNGSNGGSSSFKGIISATGGVGGQLNLGGISTVPGASGSGSGGYLNLNGGQAGQGYQVTGGYIGGPGAAPAFGSIPVPNLGSVGSFATSPGGGGSGASAAAAGGNGRAGYVIIRY